MNNINIECEDDDYYDKFIEESSPRTNYGEGYKTEKMKDEYIIINKSTLEKRIEELKSSLMISDKNEKEITTLKQILSQSTPLIPEIEKSWEDGRNGVEVVGSFPFTSTKYVNKNSHQYISN